MTDVTTDCIFCGLDSEADPEIASFYAVAVDPDGRFRAMTVNMNRSANCRHRYWMPVAWSNAADAMDATATWNRAIFDQREGSR